ncbi:MFS transporter [Streptomyces sp. NPDC049585]|uniref:MFS transporter n=1 Tax=Streptomyces sp. NPDC049585 TaxID=3155154 RepID=UPI00344453D8
MKPPPAQPSATLTPDASSSLLTRSMTAVLLCTFSGFTGFYLLLATVPEFAADAGGRAAGGAVTGLLMGATVVVQPAMPRLIAAAGHRAALLAAMLLLGAPAVVPLATDDLAVTLGCAVLRGTGFGIFVVVGSAAAAELAPPARRGAATGWYGLAAGLGGAVGTPLGVLLAHEFGYGPLFAAGALAPACGLVAALFVGAPRPRPRPAGRTRVVAGIARPAILRPLALLTAGTMASGTVVTFLPPAAPRDPVWLTPLALLCLQLSAAGSRWAAGRLGDRHGHRVLLLPATVLTAVGVLGGTATAHTGVLLALMVVFGAGFGTLQNATLVLVLQRAGDAGVGSAQWNLAFDAGLGLGGFCVGLVAQYTGYATGFVLVAAVLAALAAVALADARAHDADTAVQPQNTP